MHDTLKTPKTKKVNRRTFLHVSAVAGGGLVIGLYAPRVAGQGGRGGGPAGPGPSLSANDYIVVNPNNTFTIVAKNPETGQGIKTALPQIIADEFDVDWAQVSIKQADLDPKYAPQTEGGSRAIPNNYQNMRLVGAGGRLLMLNAAAAQWNVPVSELTTGSGTVKHASSNRTATYASLAARALTQPTPDRAAVEAVLKNPRDFKIIGKRIRGVDTLDIVTGRARYSIDLAPEGTLFAAFEKCPVFRGVAVSANLDEIKRLPGVKHAFIIEAAGQGNNSLNSGVAIVADSWWLANDARRSLKVVWNEGPTATESTANYLEQCKDMAARVAATPPTTAAQGGAAVGDVEAAFKTAAKIVEAEYYFPLLSHAPLEPQNSTALYKDGRLEIWSPSQIPSLQHPALGSGLPPQNITMHLVQAGGGFGRRLVSEYDIEVARIAKLVTDERTAAGLPSVPVKLLWTREDDMAHDQYRPAGAHYFKAGLDASGKLIAYRDFVGSTNSVVPANEFPRGFVDNMLVTAEIVKPFTRPDRRAAGAADERRVVRHPGLPRRGGGRGWAGSDSVPVGSAEQPQGPGRCGRFQSGARARRARSRARHVGVERSSSQPAEGHGSRRGVPVRSLRLRRLRRRTDGRREEGRVGEARVVRGGHRPADRESQPVRKPGAWRLHRRHEPRDELGGHD